MKAAITGGTGFIGKQVVCQLEAMGYEVTLIGRSDIKGETSLLRQKLNNASLVINLAGAPIIDKWTDYHKKNIYHSRIHTTRNLVYAMDPKSTRLFISASAIGIYSEEGVQTESKFTYAYDYLALVRNDWESEAMRLSNNIRTVIFRFGVVLGKGGALQKMLPLFKYGLGGIIGNGEQAYSWVHIKDVVEAISFVISNPECKGVHNITSPNPVSNKTFTEALAGKLKRKAILKVPAFVLKMKYGEGANVLLTGQTVIPERLLAQGFSFQFPEIDGALENIINQNSDLQKLS